MKPLRIRNFIPLFAGDLLAWGIAYAIAWLLRFDGLPPAVYHPDVAAALPLFVACNLVAFSLCGTYRMWPEFTGPREIATLVRSAAFGLGAFVAVVYLLQIDIPRSVAIASGALAAALAGGLRVAPRLGREIWHCPSGGRRVLVVGAGRAGEALVREMQRLPELRLDPVGFVDDLALKWGSRIHGVPVLGGPAALRNLVRRHGVDEIILAVPSATGVQMRRLVQCCQSAGVPYRTAPGIREIFDGRVRVQAVREVRIEDLLGRHPAAFDVHSARSLLVDRRVLVTGAAGSIGSELCRQILAHAPWSLVLVDQNETGLFELEQEILQRRPDARCDAVVCDVARPERVDNLLRRTRPHVVFHAAAYKHVPLMERCPVEAVANNVFGTFVVASAAEEHGVETFVLISTDKEVTPSSVMGATKRLARLAVQTLAARGRCRFVTVRFGNVLGSQGSVLHTFRKQILAGGPVTVTHPDVKRYFMTIPEAVQLILQGAVIGRNGEILILDMGDPVRIADMAHHMIRLSGLEPGKDVPVIFVGLRPGEKLEERLWMDDEQPRRTSHAGILATRPEIVDADQLQAGLAALQGAVEAVDPAEVLRLLSAMVPDYVPSDSCGIETSEAQDSDAA